MNHFLCSIHMRRLWRIPFCTGALLVLALGISLSPAQRPPAPLLNRYIVLLKEADPGRLEMLLSGQLDRETTLRSLVSDAAQVRTQFQKETGDDRFQTLADERPLWIVNGLAITATADRAAQLAHHPLVRAVYPNREERLIDSLVSTGHAGVGPSLRSHSSRAEDGDGFTYGLKKIHKVELGRDRPEIDGRGVVVGQIDTGIRPSHVEFKGLSIVFRDFVGNGQKPYDDNGHGTHISGTILGRGVGPMAIGVAPGVTRLVVGKAFSRRGSGSTEGILSALQWMADPDGDPATNDAPRVVSNSWGGGPSGEVYRKAVRRWVSLGIFPCFAGGNAGPRDGSVGTPGAYPESLAVGATDHFDAIAVFSSRGPSNFDGKQHLKPDVSAPGVDVFSAYIPEGDGSDADRTYLKASGTSMATPHVAGAIALLFQMRPALTIPEAWQLLESTADPLGGQESKNNTFGAGRINLESLFRKASPVHRAHGRQFKAGF